MASALDLAGVIRGLDAETLLARLRERVVPRPAQIADAFDLAEALLDPASLREAVGRFDRTALLVMQAARQAGDPVALLARLDPAVDLDLDLDGVAGAVERLAERFVVIVADDGTVSTVDGVGAVLDDEPGLSFDELAGVRPPVVLEAVAPVDEAGSEARVAERLSALVVETAEIVRALETSPARELAKGGLALPETRRLAEAARVDVDDVSVLLAAARAADLARPGSDGWEPGPEAEAWLAAPWAERWSRLVRAWLATAPPEVRAVLDERVETSWREPLSAFSEWLYPAGSAWLPERLAQFTHAAELFGLTVDGRPTAIAVTLLRKGPEAARDLVAATMPDPITTVYLQHDLTVVAPGPLAPDLEVRLRTIADVESTGLAATYRITEAKLQSALVDGETEESLRAFLEALSATGVPQPVDYLLGQAAARHGRYRVSALGGVDAAGGGTQDDDRSNPAGSDPAGTDTSDTVTAAVRAAARRLGAVSVLRADDPALLDTVEVDQELQPLTLRRVDPRAMVSGIDAETVFWALTDARYPVVLDGADRPPQRSDTRRSSRRGAGSSATSSSPAADPRAALVTRVTAASTASADDTDRAWIERQLDAAVKARIGVVVTVEMPDGSTIEMPLEPTGVGGGRLRGRDRKSDIERTLPLSSVVAVRTP